ncbi:hypothetical protein [Bosea sp. BK604]|uniref:hypothetical protein n=1 Tax=Bosea sp. BK604 TaxID=2512180 RepID=UPI001053C335|nr:hypothetical protein [Bosea sp. BK604]TCR68246.1 hypothetical protein EV560_10273 [Bosea sp. BK604]
MLAFADKLMAILADGGEEGFTEQDLALALFGSPQDDRQLLAETCERLMANGEIERRGEGTQAAPYTYHLPVDRLPRLAPH